MRRAFRIALFAAAIATGTWVGLGAPGLGRASAPGAEPTVGDRGAIREANAGARATASADARAESSLPRDVAPSDLANMPSMQPWPSLNPEASTAKAWMVAEGPLYRPESGRRLVTLTFDDGPFPETTPTVLRILAAHKVRAAFFVIGRYLDGDSPRAVASREVLKQVAAAGHLIGNHTHDHARLTSGTHTHVLEQIDQGAASIERATGKRPILFRPPFGKLDEFGQAAVRERGMELLLWSVEKQDMQRIDSHQMFRELAGQIDYKQGGIVLLHDIRFTSIAALRELLSWLHVHRWDPKHPTRIGYEIVDLPTYLREVAAAPLPYATRDELEKAREAAASARSRRRAATVARRPSAR